MNIKTYFDFLQVAMGLKDSLDATPSAQDWQELYRFCTRHALLGLGFTAVERLHATGVECPMALRMEWLAVAMKIEKINAKINNTCVKVREMFQAEGYDSCVLKGQGNLINYPPHLKKRRTPGDIDLLVQPKVKDKHWIDTLIKTARERGIKEKACYHHIDWGELDGIEIEVHYRPSYQCNPIHNRRMQKWYAERTDTVCKNTMQLPETEGMIAVPTKEFNAVYQLQHMYRHHIDGGLGLRQVIDYYYVLSSDKEPLDMNQTRKAIKSIGMKKFTAAMMWLLGTLCAMPKEQMLFKPNEEEGRALLKEMLRGGNFGQYDDRARSLKNGGVLKHAMWKLGMVMRLVRNYPMEALSEPLFRVMHLLWRIRHSRGGKLFVSHS